MTTGRGDPAPTSMAPTQEMQWELMCALSPDDPGRSRVLIVDNREIEGPLDHAALRRAFAAVTRRHDVLRLVFGSTGADPAVTIAEDVDPPVTYLDLCGLDQREQRARVDEIVFHENRRSFDLRAAPAWHAWVIRLGATSHLLNLCFSHVIADGVACGVFVQDLLAAYAAVVTGRRPWPEPALSFAHMHALQARRFERAAGRAAYWRTRLSPVARRTTFVERAPPEADLLARGGIAFHIPPATAAGIRRVAWRARTTPFVALLAAYHLLLTATSGKQRTVVASGTHARPTAGERGAVMQYVSDALVSTEAPDSSSLQGVVEAAHAAMDEAVANVAPFTAVARAVNPDFDAQRPWADYHLCDGHFYSGASAGASTSADGVTATAVYRPGRPPAGFRSDFTVGRLPERLLAAWEAWCAPSVAIGTARDRGMFAFNDRIYPAEWVRGQVDRYLWIVETLASASEIDVGTLRARHARRFGP